MVQAILALDEAPRPPRPPGGNRCPAVLACLLFSLSGAAALIFETLWFRAAGLALGSSFWASSIVLASFMAGLAVGNAIAARYGWRLRRPWRTYATVEGVVAVTGVAIVILLPRVGPVLGRLFTPLLPHPALVNVLRLAVAFVVMSVPATAMGLTLPVLAKGLEGRDGNFGRVLGRLYGWNTLGGVLGALGSDLFLIGWLGLRGTAFAAATLSLVAAAGAVLASRKLDDVRRDVTTPAPPPSVRRFNWHAWRLLGAAFLAGATLLALEVVWFRFLQLFVFATSFVFAAMLATVLLGIGLGGVVGGLWLGRDPRAHRHAPLVALGAGVAVQLSFALFDPRIDGRVFITDNLVGAAGLFVGLMLPTSVLSGVLFTMLGAAYRGDCRESTEAAGRLTLVNTFGAMVGSLLAGFALLPRLGVEGTLFLAMVTYGVAAGLSAKEPRKLLGDWRRTVVSAGVVALFVIVAARFPFGLVRGHFLPMVIERYQFGAPKVLAVREGQTETVTYLETSFRGRPLHHRLMTNGHSMSATTYRGRRYMKLYVYWALAVNPDARRALLISYGIGSTAKALVDSRQLESIDVVDISPDILALGKLAFPGGPAPLADPRVHVHVEDGRFFLETTDQTFDLITAEPPPPRGASVTNLYSREYFQLLRERLSDGGVATYWLPVNQLFLAETKAIMRAFCDAFADCTLWSGAGLQWMLAGTKGAHGPVPEERFSAQWRDPVVGPELIDMGFEAPEALGATFIADARTMAEWTRGVAPLDDDHPGRIAFRYPTSELGDPTYRAWMQPGSLRRRFSESSFVANVWPPGLRARLTETADWFGPQAVFDDLSAWGRLNPTEALHGVLALSKLRTLPLLLMGTEPAIQHIAIPLYEAGQRGADLEFEMGAGALAQRDYDAAIDHFDKVSGGPRRAQARIFETLALALAGRQDDARAALPALSRVPMSRIEASSARWLETLLARP